MVKIEKKNPKLFSNWIVWISFEALSKSYFIPTSKLRVSNFFEVQIDNFNQCAWLSCFNSSSNRSSLIIGILPQFETFSSKAQHHHRMKLKRYQLKIIQNGPNINFSVLTKAVEKIILLFHSWLHCYIVLHHLPANKFSSWFCHFRFVEAIWKTC